MSVGMRSKSGCSDHGTNALGVAVRWNLGDDHSIVRIGGMFEFTPKKYLGTLPRTSSHFARDVHATTHSTDMTSKLPPLPCIYVMQRQLPRADGSMRITSFLIKFRVVDCSFHVLSKIQRSGPAEAEFSYLVLRSI